MGATGQADQKWEQQAQQTKKGKLQRQVEKRPNQAILVRQIRCNQVMVQQKNVHFQDLFLVRITH